MIQFILGFTPAELGEAFEHQDTDELLEVIMQIVERQNNPEFAGKVIAKVSYFTEPETDRWEDNGGPVRD